MIFFQHISSISIWDVNRMFTGSIFFPLHLCVGFLFLILYPAAPPPPPPLLPHIFVNHHLSHTIFHTHLCQPPSFTHISFTHIFVNPHLFDQLCLVTHHLSHTTICHTHLCQPPSLICALVSRGRRGTWRRPPSFCVAGVALLALGWFWWRAWTGLLAGDAAALCVAGVALGDMRLRFTWQAWHCLVLRGRRGTYGTGLALVVRLDWISRRWRRGTLRGMRGTWRHLPSFRVAGVALGDIHLRFAWQA